MTAAKLCVPCGKPNRPQARFCGYSGKPFEPPFLKKAIESSGSLTPPSTSLQNKEHQLRRTNARVSIRQLRNAIALLIIISGLLGLFTYTNPTLEQYGDFIQQHVILQSEKHRRNQLVLLFLRLPSSQEGSG